MLLVSWILETQETQIAKVWNFTNLWLSRFHNILNNLNQFLILGIETCPDKSHVCYTVWINTNSNLTKHPSGSDVKLMGCWEENHDCSKTDECIEDKPHPVRHFCCCTGHLCNAKFKWDPDDPITTPKGEDTTKEFKSSSSNTGQIWLIILCTAFLILIILGLVSIFIYAISLF